jgi:hypothetical protein
MVTGSEKRARRSFITTARGDAPISVAALMIHTSPAVATQHKRLHATFVSHTSRRDPVTAETENCRMNISRLHDVLVEITRSRIFALPQSAPTKVTIEPARVVAPTATIGSEGAIIRSLDYHSPAKTHLPQTSSRSA